MPATQPQTKQQQVDGHPKAASKLSGELSGKQKRLKSLDAFRGMTMFFLVMGGTTLIPALQDVAPSGTFIDALATQFTHHLWNGLHFWDLIQPFFMFIVGVAMPFAFEKRWARGDSWLDTFQHALSRSVILLILGVGLYMYYAGELVFEFWNVLAQISFTYMAAFLIMRKSTAFQLSISFALVFLTQLAYVLWPVPDFDQPFVPDHNLGAYIDLLVTGYLSGGHWVAINAVPTAAHTIWGVLAGQVIKSNRTSLNKAQILAVAGLIGIAAGYALDPFIPIIKRICTASFVIVTGGWSLVTLAAFYWIIDIKRFQRGILLFVVFGMNPLFIYLFAHMGGAAWFRDIVSVFSDIFLGWIGPAAVAILIPTIVLGLESYLVYWLYQREIFIKI